MADDGAAESQEPLDEVDECLLGVNSEIQRGGDGGDDDDKLSSSGRGAAERGPGAERDAPTEASGRGGGLGWAARSTSRSTRTCST